MRRLFLLTALLVCALLRSAALSQGDLRETHRIRIINEVDGAVQVSIDQGKTYTTVGRVTRPATSRIQGFAASAFAQDGKIAAIAVHAIRIRSGSIRMRDGNVAQVFSIIPREFAKPGGDFGTGEIAGTSGIYTDIPAGTAIFRNLSPIVGNPVFLERYANLRALPPNYVPFPGDTLVILAQVHDERPDEIVIENRKGGAVEAVYGESRRTIAVVQHPVLGIGRFDATEYTGVGAINTNHTGVVTVSTAPVSGKRNGSAEPRGGFQILPSKHAAHIGRIPQYMVVAPPTTESTALEGAPPLFSEYISLAHDPDTPRNSLRVDIRAGGTDWRPLSTLVGKQDNALANYVGTGQAVTHIRLRFPEHSDAWMARQLRTAADSYVRARYGSKPPSRGIISFSLTGADLQGVSFASLYVDRQFRGISSSQPFSFRLDTSKLSPGEHCVEIRGSDKGGIVQRSTRQWFYTVDDSVNDSVRDL